MNKFLTKILLFFLLTFSHGFSEIIENIEVNGNKRISKETIIVLGQIEINQDFSTVDLNNTLKDCMTLIFLEMFLYQLIKVY